MPTSITPAAALKTLGVAEDTYGPTVNTARSPEAVDVLGESLAESLRTVQAAKLAVWNTSDEAVLVHSVAHYLSVGVSRASEIEGVLSLNEDLGAGTRVVLLATQWSRQRLEILRRLVTSAGGRPVAVAAVLSSEALAAVDDVRTIALLSADEAKELGL